MNQKNKVTVVCKKVDLWEAVKRKDPCIEIQGDLTKKMKWLGVLPSVKKKRLAIELEKLKFSGNISTCRNSAVTAIVGEDIAIIIFSLGVSMTLIIAVLRDYDVEICGGTIKLTKKQRRG